MINMETPQPPDGPVPEEPDPPLEPEESSRDAA